MGIDDSFQLKCKKGEKILNTPVNFSLEHFQQNDNILRTIVNCDYITGEHCKASQEKTLCCYKIDVPYETNENV